MNVFYEENGEGKVGCIVNKSDATVQIDTLHGKRIKLKAAHILLEFNTTLEAFLPAVKALSAELDPAFLWECCPAEEFSFEALAQEYWGHKPSAIEAAAVLQCLSSAPVYFHKRNKGCFKAALPEILHSALATLERKKNEQRQIDQLVAALLSGECPDAICAKLNRLLFKPEKNSLEFKAFDKACRTLSLLPVQLAQKIGAIRSAPDYLLSGFLFEHFPQGTDFQYERPFLIPDVTELPLAAVQAFSIDDASTTEIDDAFSLTWFANGHCKVGIHIAAPTLGIPIGSTLEKIVYSRLSTVYFPGEKITMLPDEVVDAFTLQQGKESVCAVSLYVDVTPAFEIVGFENRIERIAIAANLRHIELENVFNEDTLLSDPGVDYPFKQALTYLWHFANALEKRRGKYDPLRTVQLDYTFTLLEEKVLITPRRRGAPIDKVVAELMILANSEWGRMLAQSSFAAIYRAQSVGKVRLTTQAEPHQGLGVAQYTWATSPLRRATDFVNQRQLVALIRQQTPPFAMNDEALLTIMRDFDQTYSAYLAFQDKMEHFWCLRYLVQEGVSETTARYIKDDWAQIDGLPLRVKPSGLPSLASGAKIRVAIGEIDEWLQTIQCRYVGEEPAVQAPSST